MIPAKLSGANALPVQSNAAFIPLKPVKPVIPDCPADAACHTASLLLAKSATATPDAGKAVVKVWSVYLVRAANGALYCGISDDPQRRFQTHVRGKGARFFYTSPAVALVYVQACADKGAALRRERAIKRLKKSAKEALLTAVIEVLDKPPSACAGRLLPS